MSKKKIELNSTDISERRQIISSFCEQMQHTALLATDISDHKCQLEKVYKQMLHEAGVIDECRRRFERMFRRDDFYFIEVKDGG